MKYKDAYKIVDRFLEDLNIDEEQKDDLKDQLYLLADDCVADKDHFSLLDCYRHMDNVGLANDKR